MPCPAWLRGRRTGAAGGRDRVQAMPCPRGPEPASGSRGRAGSRADGACETAIGRRGGPRGGDGCLAVAARPARGGGPAARATAPRCTGVTAPGGARGRSSRRLGPLETGKRPAGAPRRGAPVRSGPLRSGPGGMWVHGAPRAPALRPPPCASRAPPVRRVRRSAGRGWARPARGEMPAASRRPAGRPPAPGGVPGGGGAASAPPCGLAAGGPPPC